jgi:hypothetical protein
MLFDSRNPSYLVGLEQEALGRQAPPAGRKHPPLPCRRLWLLGDRAFCSQTKAMQEFGEGTWEERGHFSPSVASPARSANRLGWGGATRCCLII